MNSALDTLRDRTADTAAFRHAARRLCDHLLRKTKDRMRERGVDPHEVVVVLILRAGAAFLDGATHAFPGAPIGVLGLKRDERTFVPQWYYENLPLLSVSRTVLICDPMLATGGSAEAAVEKLRERGADPARAYFTGVVAAPEGIARLSDLLPKEHIIVASVDEGLDDHGMIVPGIGDFGDRYFGYVGRAVIT